MTTGARSEPHVGELEAHRALAQDRLRTLLDDELMIDHGSLYPALQRLERGGLISSDWGTSENLLAAG